MRSRTGTRHVLFSVVITLVFGAAAGIAQSVKSQKDRNNKASAEELRIIQVPTQRSNAADVEREESTTGPPSVRKRSADDTARKRQPAPVDRESLLFSSSQLLQRGKIDWSGDQGIAFIRGPLTLDGFLPTPFDGPAAALKFLTHHKDVFKLENPEQELALRSTWTDDLGLTHVYFEQVWRGVAVWNTELAAHFSKAGALAFMRGRYFRTFDGDVEPKLTATEVVQILGSDETTAEARLVFFPTGRTFTLAWEVSTLGRDNTSKVHVVAADSGTLLHQVNVPR